MSTIAANSAAKVLREIESLSSRRFLPIIGPAKGKLLEKLVQEHRPQLIVEVGTLVGYSAILMAQHLPPEGRLITLESNPTLAKIARENIQRAGLAQRITVVEGDALHTITTISAPFDMLFLDATKEEYLDYLRLTEEGLKVGGMVVADNVGIFASAMADYLQYVRESDRYRSQYHDFGFDGMEVSIKLA